MKIRCTLILFLAVTVTNCAFAVNSKITRHSSASQMLSGEIENVIVDSQGTITLARSSKELDLNDLLKDVWTINCLTSDSKGNLYIGTSPNGKIIKYTKGKAHVIYEPAPPKDADPLDIVNEHIFAMTIDAGNRLIAAVSGPNCRLVRFEKNNPKTLYEPEDTNYILSLATDQIGNIFIGTGPEGKIYRLDTFGKNPTLVYDCQDNNILSLAVDADGFVYAGSDERGLVYKINQAANKASVLYDTDQEEITALMFDENNNLYAAATSALAAANQKRFKSIAAGSSAGRSESNSDNGPAKGSTDTNLKTPNTKPEKTKDTQKQQQVKRGKRPDSSSHIYRIDPQGFVTDIFNEAAVFFAIAQENNSILLGTGNNAELFSIDPETEIKSIAYQNDTSAQITAVTVFNDKVYLGTANPAKLIELSTNLAEEGIYTSEPIDAQQPSQWGKLQIDASVPEACTILLSARSGNVKDPNDPTFSDWTEPVEIIGPTQLDCPVARYCQYKLTLQTSDDSQTPAIGEIAIPHVIPNLPPKVAEVKTSISKDKDPQQMTVNYVTNDHNNDDLSYTIELRKIGRQKWIKLKDNHTDNNFQWNTLTVEDGEYEIRVTADDKLSNTPATKLSASRISDPFIVDNSAPEVITQQIMVVGDTATLNLGISDWLTIIGNISYTVDGSEEWTSAIPDDFVYDTTSEDFTIEINKLEDGEHIIAVRMKDDIGNTAYKTYVVQIQ